MTTRSNSAVPIASARMVLPQVVIVSPYFPPSTLAGVHRARHLAKHLPAAGWWPIVLSVDEAHHEQRLDPDLAALVPPSVEIVKVGALPARITRWFGVGEVSLRAHGHLRKALFRLLAARPVDAVLITGSPYYPMVLAPEIRRRFNVPVVLDFQDPWVSAWGARQPAASKAGLSHRLATLLEPRALRGANFITSVSEIQNEELVARYPWLDASRMAAIPIGGDPEDFEHLAAAASATASVEQEPGRVECWYVGSFWPSAEAPIRILLRALAKLRSENPQTMQRLRLNFVGTDPTVDGETHTVQRIAEEEGVAEHVREMPKRLPYLDALNLLAHADRLLLIGSIDPHYTASKIYPALMSGRPFLSLFHHASSAQAILTAAGGGLAHSFRSVDELDRLVPELAMSLSKLVLAPEELGTVDPAAYAPFEARAIAARYAAIFDQVSRRD